MEEQTASEADARLQAFGTDDDDPFAPAPEGETEAAAVVSQEPAPEVSQAATWDTLVVDDLGIELPDGVKGKTLKEAFQIIEADRKKYAPAYHAENRYRNENESLRTALEILKGNQSAPVQPQPVAPQPYAGIDPDKDLWSDPSRTLRSVHDSAVETATRAVAQQTQSLQREVQDLKNENARTHARNAWDAAGKAQGVSAEDLEFMKPIVAGYVAANNNRLSPFDAGSYEEGIKYARDLSARLTATKAPAVPPPPVSSVRQSSVTPKAASVLTPSDMRKINSVAHDAGINPAVLAKSVEEKPWLLETIRGGRRS